MKKINLISIIFILFTQISFSDINSDFEEWKKDFKKIALKNNISEDTFNLVMGNTKYLPNVIKYDR